MCIVLILAVTRLFQILTTVHRFRVVLTTSVLTWSMAIRVHVQLAISRTTLQLSA